MGFPPRGWTVAPFYEELALAFSAMSPLLGPPSLATAWEQVQGLADGLVFPQVVTCHLLPYHFVSQGNPFPVWVGEPWLGSGDEDSFLFY